MHRQISVALILVLTVLASVPADAATVKLFDPPTHQYYSASPKVAFNPDVNNFLVVGSEGFQLKSRRTGLRGGGQGPWKLRSRKLGSSWWLGGTLLAYNSKARAYLVVTDEWNGRFRQLNKRGQVASEAYFPGVYDVESLALTAMGDSGMWLGWIEECKYACRRSAHIIWPGGGTGTLHMDRLPLEDRYIIRERQWQLGYNPNDQTFLILWEDDLDGRYSGPSLAIRGQRFGQDGRLVGDRIEIASHSKDASQPHMVYSSQRKEWLVVYRRGNKIKGRFLRDGQRTREFRFPGSRSGMVPSIAYSPRRDSYLVTWVQSGKGAGIYGQWLRANGDLVGDRFKVNDRGGDQWVSEPGYSACNDTGACLVTWINDGEGGTTRGQYLQVPRTGSR